VYPSGYRYGAPYRFDNEDILADDWEVDDPITRRDLERAYNTAGGAAGLSPQFVNGMAKELGLFEARCKRYREALERLSDYFDDETSGMGEIIREALRETDG